MRGSLRSITRMLQQECPRRISHSGHGANLCCNGAVGCENLALSESVTVRASSSLSLSLFNGMAELRFIFNSTRESEEQEVLALESQS